MRRMVSSGSYTDAENSSLDRTLSSTSSFIVELPPAPPSGSLSTQSSPRDSHTHSDNSSASSKDTQESICPLFHQQRPSILHQSPQQIPHAHRPYDNARRPDPWEESIPCHIESQRAEINGYTPNPLPGRPKYYDPHFRYQGQVQDSETATGTWPSSHSLLPRSPSAQSKQLTSSKKKSDILQYICVVFLCLVTLAALGLSIWALVHFFSNKEDTPHSTHPLTTQSYTTTPDP